MSHKLYEQATIWLDAEIAYRKAMQALADAEANRAELHARRNTVAAELTECVTKDHPRKVIRVRTGNVVIVDYNQGISVHELVGSPFNSENK